ncbi:hypothetical protein ACLMJK_000313 [Lecanora helva]
MDPPQAPNPPPSPSTKPYAPTATIDTTATTTKAPALNNPSRRGIQGEKWTPEEEVRLRALWDEFQGLSASRYAVEIWMPISERMPGRKPDACHQKAYRMGLLSEKGGKEPGTARKSGERKVERGEKRKSVGAVGSAGGSSGRAGGQMVVRREKREKQQLQKRMSAPEKLIPVPVAQAYTNDEVMVDAGEDPGQVSALAQVLLDAAHGGDVSEDEESEDRWSAASRAEDAWKHDRNSARGRMWRLERHEARKKWEKGFPAKTLARFCPSVCEGCEEERINGAR